MGQLGVCDSQLIKAVCKITVNQLLFAMALFGNIIEINGFAATYFPDQALYPHLFILKQDGRNNDGTDRDSNLGSLNL